MHLIVCLNLYSDENAKTNERESDEEMKEGKTNGEKCDGMSSARIAGKDVDASEESGKVTSDAQADMDTSTNGKSTRVRHHHRTADEQATEEESPAICTRMRRNLLRLRPMLDRTAWTVPSNHDQEWRPLLQDAITLIERGKSVQNRKEL